MIFFTIRVIVMSTAISVIIFSNILQEDLNKFHFHHYLHHFQNKIGIFINWKRVTSTSAYKLKIYNYKIFDVSIISNVVTDIFLFSLRNIYLLSICQLQI